MIPLFPKFKKLELEDKVLIEKYTSKYEGYSDFNFVSLWSYNTEDDIIFSILNDNLVVRFRDYITNEKFYSFIGTNKAAETIDTLLIHFEHEGISPQLKLIPEVNILLLKNELEHRFDIQEDTDNHDYILSASEHSKLQTSNFYKHRKVINKFYRNNPEFTVKELDLSDKKLAKELLSLFYLWENKKGKKRSDTLHELIALNRTIKDSARLKLVVLGVYNHDQLIGIIVADVNHTKYIESHFLKYHPDYYGMNHLLHHLLAKHLADKDFEYINIEQDLGIEGLRTAKESAKPIKFLKKYTISKKIN